jgi:hypothetical protein
VIGAPQMQKPVGGLAIADTKTHATDFNALDKPAADTVAKLAFKGHVVHSCMDGSFIVCKYGMSHYAQDFDELKAFAKKLGVLNDPI